MDNREALLHKLRLISGDIRRLQAEVRAIRTSLSPVTRDPAHCTDALPPVIIRRNLAALRQNLES